MECSAGEACILQAPREVAHRERPWNSDATEHEIDEAARTPCLGHAPDVFNGVQIGRVRRVPDEERAPPLHSSTNAGLCVKSESSAMNGRVVKDNNTPRTGKWVEKWCEVHLKVAYNVDGS